MFTSSSKLWGQLLLALALLCPVVAQAVDGAIEINHARIMAGGVTPGDAPGYPATISRRGRFVLTGDLVTSSGSTDAVVINYADVQLDLNGFSIHCGESACSGSGRGVVANYENVLVENGSIFNFGGAGVEMPQVRNRVVNLHVVSNAKGIVLGQDARVLDSEATNNRGAGVTVGQHSNVTRSIITANSGTGLIAAQSSVIQSNTIVGNQAGVQGGDSTLVVENVIRSGWDSSSGAVLSCVACSVVDNWLYGRFLDRGVDASNFSGNRITSDYYSGNLDYVASTGINYCNGFVNIPTGEVVEWGRPVSGKQPIYCGYLGPDV